MKLYITSNLSKDLLSSKRDITSRKKGSTLLIFNPDGILYDSINCYQHNLNDDNFYKASYKYQPIKNSVEEDILNYVTNKCVRILTTKKEGEPIELFIKKNIIINNNYYNDCNVINQVKNIIYNEINIKPQKIWLKSCDRTHIWYHIKF